MSTQPVLPAARQGFLTLFASFSPAVRKNLLVLLSAQALATGATTVSTTLSSIIMEHITGNTSLSGVPATINFFVSALAAFLAGRLMAARGRRVGLSLGFAIGMVGAVLAAWMALEKNLVGFLLGGALVGACNGTVAQGRYAAGEMVGAVVRGRVMGSLATGSVLGTVLGYGVQRLVQAFSFGRHWPEIELGWFVGAAFLGFGAVLIWAFLRPDPKSLAVRLVPKTSDQGAVTGDFQQPLRSWRVLLALPWFRFALVCTAFGQGLMVMLMVLTPLHASHLGFDAPLLISVHIVGMFGFAWLVGGLVDAWGKRPVAALGALQIIVAALVAHFATQMIELEFSMFVVGLGWSFLSIAGSAALTDALEPHERAKVQGGAEMVVWVFAACGALGGGLIVGNFGYATVGVLAVAIACVPLLVALGTKDR